MTTMTRTIATEVRARREALNISQAALATAAGISLSSVSKLENGITTGLSYRTRHALAAALGWTVDSFDLIDAGKKPTLIDAGRPTNIRPAPAPYAELTAAQQEALEALFRSWGKPLF